MLKRGSNFGKPDNGCRSFLHFNELIQRIPEVAPGAV
jgi:hypothetical protein